jgi:hypothetical protein
VPSNFCGGAGNCEPSIVVVALGEPGVPVICCAYVAGPIVIVATATNPNGTSQIFPMASMADLLSSAAINFNGNRTVLRFCFLLAGPYAKALSLTFGESDIGPKGNNSRKRYRGGPGVISTPRRSALGHKWT